MDNQTFFSVMLGFGFTVGVGVAIYAMSISAIEPRLANGGAVTAWLFGVSFCVCYGGTNEMHRFWRYGIASLTGAALTLCLCIAIDYIRTKEAALKGPSDLPRGEEVLSASIEGGTINGVGRANN